MIYTELELSARDMMHLNVHDEYSIHQLVYSMFASDPPKQRDFLYLKKRETADQMVIKILSQRNPLIPGSCRINSVVVPDAFFLQREYFFSVKVNPMRRSQETSKAYPIRGRANLLKWFYEKAEQAGMRVCTRNLEIRDHTIEKIVKKDITYTFSSVVFAGQCRVENKKKFLYTVKNGFGRARTFGFGLLELRPIIREI